MYLLKKYITSYHCLKVVRMTGTTLSPFARAATQKYMPSVEIDGITNKLVEVVKIICKMYCIKRKIVFPRCYSWR